MGTYYGLGIIREFTAKSSWNSYNEGEWKEVLSSRLDLDLYNLDFEEKQVQGKLNEMVFKNNIKDLYSKLEMITGDEDICYYLEEYGDDLNNYGHWPSTHRIRYSSETIKAEIKLEVDLALLYIEGKVLVEEFSSEPRIMNWLFRHSTLDNPLVGCIISDIIG